MGDVSPETARVIAAIRGGEVVILPTDTVYGLAADGLRREPVASLYRLKGRDASQPIALVAASVAVLLDCIPELRGAIEAVLRGLLPGPFTLVVPNPAHRFPWLTGSRPEAIGVRVPQLAGSAAAVLQAVGAVAATSANLPGGGDPRALEDVPGALTGGVAAIMDGGPLPGVASTVVDLTGAVPVILREGAVATSAALERIREAASAR
jgi:L-threonylcarbamoyladenylate synthase